MSSHDAAGPVELSAVVMLQPGPTSDTTPDPASVDALRATFLRLGFDVGPAVAISFSISGPNALFDERFPSAAPVLELLRTRSGEAAADEVFLPVDDLGQRDDWAGVAAIFFPERPAFGPGNP